MVTTFGGALSRFMNPAERVSAHYLVGTDGRVAQIVSDDDTAYHAGNYDANLRAIGIEHEAWPANPQRGIPALLPSDALYAASAELHRKLSQDHGIRLVVGDTVLPHNAIVPTQCPGTLDLDRIVREALEEPMAVTEEDFSAYKDDVRNTFGAIKEVLAALAAGQARDETRDAELAESIKDTEVKAVVEAILSVKTESLKPKP